MPCKMLITMAFWVAKRFDNISTQNIKQLESSVIRTRSNHFTIRRETSTTDPICMSGETRYELLIRNWPQFYLLVIRGCYQLLIENFYMKIRSSIRVSILYLTALWTKINVSNSWSVSIKLWRWSQNCRSPYTNSSVGTGCSHQITTRWPTNTIHSVTMTTKLITSNWAIQIP